MKYKYKPKTKEELIETIEKEIYEVQGTPDNPNWNADLNCIDTSEITDMSDLFSNLDEFNGNISDWDVSNVTNMKYMFLNSKFNGEISKWNVSNVKNMYGMFFKSRFNQDISKWNVSNVKNMKRMFKKSKFDGDISKWNVSNVEDMTGMFEDSEFDGNISDWDVSNVIDMKSMFAESKFNGDISNWDVSNVTDMKYMFYESIFNQDISNWNVSNVKDMERMLRYSTFNKDIGNWPSKIKEQTGLKNISVSDEYSEFPDKIKYPETVANIFNFVINNPDSKKITIKQAINILTRWLNNRQEKYINKGLNKNTIKQLLINDFLKIYKRINDKDKFLNLLKQNKINLNLDLDKK